jgi:hypothetical protein
VVLGEADLAPEEVAAVPDALPGASPSAANAQLDIIAIVVAKMIVEIFMTFSPSLCGWVDGSVKTRSRQASRYVAKCFAMLTIKTVAMIRNETPPITDRRRALRER